MYESNKKSNKNPTKIFLKSSLKENQIKENQKEISLESKKNKEIHEKKLKEIQRLEKELNNIEKQNELTSKELYSLKIKYNNLTEKEEKINNEVETENRELEQLKEINITKNREYRHLLQLRNRQINNNTYNNNNNDTNQNITSNRNDTNSNNENENVREDELLNGLNFLLTISRIRRSIDEEGRNESSINEILNNRHNNDEGPPMTYNQLQALPSSIYSNRNNSSEKCIICGFDFCYNDEITKLRCEHTFHKNCLVNRLRARNSSKCPTCKTSVI